MLAASWVSDFFIWPTLDETKEIKIEIESNFITKLKIYYRFYFIKASILLAFFNLWTAHQ